MQYFCPPLYQIVIVICIKFKILRKNEDFDTRDKTERAITDEIHKRFGQSVALALSTCPTKNDPADLADLKRISYTSDNNDENS